MNYTMVRIVENILKYKFGDKALLSHEEIKSLLEEFMTYGDSYLTDDIVKPFDRRSETVKIFKSFVEYLFYRNVANYDSMVLISSEKGCLTDDTLIDMPRDLKKYPKGIPIKDLINKKDFYVYSYNIKKNKLEVKKAESCEFAKIADVYEIEFKDGRKIKATHDHPFYLMDGTCKELKDLNWSKFYGNKKFLDNDKVLKKTDRIRTIVRPDFLDNKQLLKTDYSKGGIIKNIKYIGKRKTYDIVGVKDNKNFIANGCVVGNTGKSSFAIMLAKYWCNLIGIEFDPDRHIAYSNKQVNDKIDNLNKFEPIICLSGDSEVLIRDLKDNKIKNVKIKDLVGRKDFEVKSYNIKDDKFEWVKTDGAVLNGINEEVFEVELENGKKIKATKDHKFLTKNGYKKLKDLTEEDEIIINSNNCKICGKEFIPKSVLNKYCSKKCDNIFIRNKRRNVKKIKICKICGKEFNTGLSHKKYCSKECYYSFNYSVKRRLRKKLLISNPEKYKKYKETKKRIKEEYEKDPIKYKENLKIRRKYYNIKKKDPHYRICKSLRSNLSHTLKSNDFIKKTKLKDAIGCSVKDLKKYLELKFTEGMSWDNYGEWHIDHIRPCVSFDLSKKEEQKKCFHYTNLQPLWAKYNLSKGAKYDNK